VPDSPLFVAHSRYFWRLRLYGIFASDGTLRVLEITSLKRDEREVDLTLLARRRRRGGKTLLCDKGHAGREFGRAVKDLDSSVVRPHRRDEPGESPHLAPIHQRIESIFSSRKGILALERHGARTLAGLRERGLQRFLCLAACMSLNHQLARPNRAPVDYCAWVRGISHLVGATS